jgi:S-adenosylmethionine decarboxylase
MPKMERNTIKFGEHLIFDAYGCPLNKLNNQELCYEILRKIIELTGMRQLCDPVVVPADSNETLGGKDPGGFSGFVMIQESHISIHTFAKRGFVTIDLYSCKPFEADEVIKYLNEVFEAKDSDVLKLERGLKYPLDNIY